MSISDILNGTTLYIAVTAGLLFMVGFALVLLKKAWKHALYLGYTKEILMKVIKSSFVFSIIPSLAIVVGLFSLSSVLGIPWSWFRLSVIGSLPYELMAAEMSVTAAGYDSLSAFMKSGDISIITTIMLVMSMSIIGGVIMNAIFGKKIQSGMLNFQNKNDEWGALAMSYFPLAMAVVFLPVQLLKGPVYLATILTSAAIAFIHLIVIKKYKVKWLGEFLLANTLILGMISSVFWDKLLG